MLLKDILRISSVMNLGKTMWVLGHFPPSYLLILCWESIWFREIKHAHVRYNIIPHLVVLMLI
jgi:hypothetical protein